MELYFIPENYTSGDVMKLFFQPNLITMPLKVAKSKSKKSINAAVAANIHELVHKGTMQRPMKQIIAIAESAARKGKGGKRLMKKK